MKKEYVPERPYILKSGDHAGEALGLLALNDIGFLEQQLGIRKQEDKGRKEESKIHQHLKWLLGVLKNVKPTAICPICKSRRVEYFMIQTIGENTKINEDHICCSGCSDRLLEKAQIGTPLLIPLTFSSLKKFYHYNYKKRRLTPKPIARKVKKVFLKAFQIEKTSRLYIFNWFKRKAQTMELYGFPVEFEGEQSKLIL
jgi:hypothetical protein